MKKILIFIILFFAFFSHSYADTLLTQMNSLGGVFWGQGNNLFYFLHGNVYDKTGQKIKQTQYQNQYFQYDKNIFINYKNKGVISLLSGIPGAAQELEARRIMFYSSGSINTQNIYTFNINDIKDNNNIQYFFSLHEGNLMKIKLKKRNSSSAHCFIVNENLTLTSYTTGCSDFIGQEFFPGEYLKMGENGQFLVRKEENAGYEKIYAYRYNEEAGVMQKFLFGQITDGEGNIVGDVLNRNYLENEENSLFRLLVGNGIGAMTWNYYNWEIINDSLSADFSEYDNLVATNYGEGWVSLLPYSGYDGFYQYNFIGGYAQIFGAENGFVYYMSDDYGVYLGDTSFQPTNFTPPSGGTGGTGGTGTGVIYDPDYNWDIDGDGVVSWSETISGVGHSIYSFFAGIGDFFNNFGDFFGNIAKIGNPENLDPFGFFITKTYADSNDLTDAFSEWEWQEGAITTQFFWFFIYFFIFVFTGGIIILFFHK